MTTTPLSPPDTALAASAAEAAASVLPSVNPLSVADAQPGSDNVAAAFRGAVVAPVIGTVNGRLGVLVGDELVEALASSPTPGLELAAAVQPAIDAAAAALGTSAGPASQVDLSVLDSVLGDAFTVVPLIGAGFAAAVVLSDDLLAPAITPTPLPATPLATAAPVLPTEAVTVSPSAVPESMVRASHDLSGTTRRGIEMLHGVDMELTVELGRTRMAVRDLLALSPGDVLELDRAAGSPADLLVNGRLIARGEVVVVDEDFGLRITQIVEDGVS